MAAGGRLLSRVAASSRLDLVRASAGVAPGLTASLGGLVVASGLLPPAFSLATGALAQAVPMPSAKAWARRLGIGSPSPCWWPR